jgi:GntR family transcriptional regulator
MYIIQMAAAPRVSVDLASSIPAYRQIANGLRQHLVEGRVKPGDLLPPVRQLALDLGVHFNTVALAYRSLADEGWLDLRRRRGATVLERDAPAAPLREQADRLLRRLSEVTAELRTAGVPPRKIAAALRRLAEGVEP